MSSIGYMTLARFFSFFVFDDWHFHIDSRIPLDIEQYVMIDGDVNERHSATTEVMTAWESEKKEEKKNSEKLTNLIRSCSDEISIE